MDNISLYRINTDNYILKWQHKKYRRPARHELPYEPAESNQWINLKHYIKNYILSCKLQQTVFPVRKKVISHINRQTLPLSILQQSSIQPQTKIQHIYPPTVSNRNHRYEYNKCLWKQVKCIVPFCVFSCSLHCRYNLQLESLVCNENYKLTNASNSMHVKNCVSVQRRTLCCRPAYSRVQKFVSKFVRNPMGAFTS